MSITATVPLAVQLALTWGAKVTMCLGAPGLTLTFTEQVIAPSLAVTLAVPALRICIRKARLPASPGPNAAGGGKIALAAEVVTVTVPV